MNITIELTPELERQVRERARAAGVAAEDYVRNALAQQLKETSSNSPPCLSLEESRLLVEINQGLPEEAWRRYQQLVSKRQAATLTTDEHEDLKLLTDEIETANAKRLAKLVALARLRQVSLDALMEELGIRDPGHV
jgi:hypothetical protein